MVRGTLTVAALVVACAGMRENSGADAGVRDAPAMDVSLLADGVLLEPGLPDFSRWGAAQDEGSPTMADSEAHDLAADSLPEATVAPDMGPVLDAQEPRDADILADPLQPDTDALNLCGEAGIECGPGMACLPDEDTGIPRCRFVAECSEKGAVVLEDLLDFVVSPQGLYIKVKAKVRVGPPACTMLPCPASEPCCNACFAPLVIGSKKFPILLLGQGITFGCQGSECDYSLACSPVKPDDWYLIWGTLVLMGGEAQFLVDSFCPAAEATSGHDAPR